MLLFTLIAPLLAASLPLCALADEYEDLFSADPIHATYPSDVPQELRGRSAELPEISEKSHLHEAHPHGGRHYDEHRHHAHRHYHYDNPEVLFRYIFSKSKVKFDPRAESSPFFWGPIADLAHVQQKYNHVSLITLPHSRPAAPDEPEALNDYDVIAITDANFTLDSPRHGRTQHLKASARLSCRQFGVEQHPFPKELVRDAQDDLRLASCSFGFANRRRPYGLRITIALTNKGIWASYTAWKDNEESADGFVQVRRLATRRDKKSTHNVAVELTNRGEAIFRVEGDALWSIERLGEPSPDRRAITVMRFGDSGRYAQRDTVVRARFSTDSSLDYSDPNDARQKVGLVRLATSSPYSREIKFYDDEARRTNRLFGQGTQMDMYTMSVVKFNSYDRHGDESRRH